MSRVAFRDVYLHFSLRPSLIREDIRTLRREIGFFLERGWWGYARCDAWSLPHYMDTWMPSLLEHYRDAAPMPTSFGLQDDDYEGANIVWNAILDQMKEGFEADYKIVNWQYDGDEEYKALTKKAKKARKLFAKWYGALWN